MLGNINQISSSARLFEAVRPVRGYPEPRERSSARACSGTQGPGFWSPAGLKPINRCLCCIKIAPDCLRSVSGEIYGAAALELSCC